MRGAHRLFAIIGQRRGHLDEVRAVGARRGVRAQLLIAAVGPVARFDGAQDFVLARAVHRPPPRSRSAILRRARNSSALTLARVTPRTLAISSCDEPCA